MGDVELLIDTHCHLHDTEFYGDKREEAYRQSREAGVVMLCVGTDVRSSEEAVEFARSHEGCLAVVGIHPHEAKHGGAGDIERLIEADKAHENPVIVGIGEIGLDYYYDHSPREVQATVLRRQLDLAVRYGLPVSFHVRDASEHTDGTVWDDFWPIFDEYDGTRGVLHSFTDTEQNARQALRRGLYIGINGISTFTTNENQQKIYRELPLESILLETDAPFLTPKPFRGKMNVPAYVGRVAEHQALLKHVPVATVARITTANAQVLFGEKIR